MIGRRNVYTVVLPLRMAGMFRIMKCFRFQYALLSTGSRERYTRPPPAARQTDAARKRQPSVSPGERRAPQSNSAIGGS